MTCTSHHCPSAFFNLALENYTALVNLIPHSHRLSFLLLFFFFAVTVLRISRWISDWSFPHKSEGPLNATHSTAINQPGETLEWMGKAARSGLYMNERANPWHSVLENGFSCHTLREANWAVMRSTSPLSLTAGDSITSHANWPGLSFLGGNPGNS